MGILLTSEFMRVVTDHPLGALMYIFFLILLIKTVWQGVSNMGYWSSQDHKLIFSKDTVINGLFVGIGGTIEIVTILSTIITIRF